MHDSQENVLHVIVQRFAQTNMEYVATTVDFYWTLSKDGCNM